MTALHFKGELLKRVVEHSQKVKRKIPYEDKYTKKMGVWLVKDEGIYLMAPTDEERDRDENGHIVVCYAQGFSPKVEDLWNKTYAVSRDDFAEFIPLNDEQVADILAAPIGQKALTIRLTKTELRISTYDYHRKKSATNVNA
tara:strand:+ start:43 stop:468 length:426 start_codon:yes stop_codon:yes gene_type:complete